MTEVKQRALEMIRHRRKDEVRAENDAAIVCTCIHEAYRFLATSEQADFVARSKYRAQCEKHTATCRKGEFVWDDERVHVNLFCENLSPIKNGQVALHKIDSTTHPMRPVKAEHVNKLASLFLQGHLCADEVVCIGRKEDSR